MVSNIEAFVKLATLEFPRYEGDIRLEYPDMGDVFVLPDAYAAVYSTEKPVVGPYEAVVYGPPTNIDGQWYTTWSVIDNTPVFDFQGSNGATYKRKPFCEKLWVDGTIYREAVSVVTHSGQQVLATLREKFPDTDVGAEPLECVGLVPAGVRPPYSNPNVSWYTWKLPPQDILDEYNVQETSFFPWYGKKFDLVTGEISLKITHTHPIPKPAALPLGGRHGFGKIYHSDGTADKAVDYYVECSAEDFRSFTAHHNLNFPLANPSEYEVLGYGVVFDADTLDIHMVKAYTMHDITMKD